MHFCYSTHFEYIYINMFLTSKMLFFSTTIFGSRLQMLQQAASKGAAPKAKAKAKAVATQSPKKEEGGVAIAAIPKRDLWLVVFVACIFLCVFFCWLNCLTLNF